MRPVRIQLRRTAGWRKPPDAVVVSRPGKYGNPFRSAAAFRAWLVDGTVDRTQLIGSHWIPWTLKTSERLEQRRRIILRAIPDLTGKDLCCWCGLLADCHADVLIDLANTTGPDTLQP